MDKILPVITDTDPIPEEVINASDWYETQYCDGVRSFQLMPGNEPGVTYSFSTLSGGSSSSTAQTDVWLLSQGWTPISSVLSTVPDPLPSTHGVYQEVTTKRWMRRVLKSEKALNSLISSYTKAYNEGRQLNDSRYDELVVIYMQMLDKSENDLISLATDDSTYEYLIGVLIAALDTDYTTYKALVDGKFSAYGGAQRSRIATQFDNQIGVVRSDLISKGMYNTTVYNSLVAGIERERALALNDLEDKILDKQVSLDTQTYQFQQNMRDRVLAARDRLRAQINEQKINAVTLRNNVLTSFLTFVERRSDTYPDLTSVGNIAASLGAGSISGTAP